jgi:hypothetical protein
MPATEIATAVNNVNALLNIAKAMIGLRDAEMFRARVIEFEGMILDSLTKAVQATEAQAAQLDEIRSLKAEVANLKAWDAEKPRYELKSIGSGSVAYILKPSARGSEPPHWLCPNCFTQGKKSFFQSSGKMSGRTWVYDCVGCRSSVGATSEPTMWPN